MEKKTFNLCSKVLKRLNRAGILQNIILIGSWCAYFYSHYFKSPNYSLHIRTSDIDFLVPIPFKFEKKLSLYDLVKDLGYVEEFRGSKGYIKLSHPDLTIEFLVPERGRQSDKPYPLPQLGINAQPLRRLDFLIQNVISLSIEGMKIHLPHPAAYALHKFIIFKERKNIDKHDRDIEGALRVFKALIDNKEYGAIRRIFNKMPKKWQRDVLKNLKSIEEFEVINILQGKV